MVWILQQCVFYHSAGNRTVIVGESRSGKSSISHLVLDLYVPTSGRVLIADRETTGIPSKLAAAT